MENTINNKRNNIIELDQETEKYYEATINYYMQKRLNFFKTMAKKNNKKYFKKIMNDFQNKIKEEISEKWENIKKEIYNNVELGSYNAFIIKDTAVFKEVPDYILDVLKNKQGTSYYNGKKGRQDISGKPIQFVLGDEFEIFTEIELKKLAGSIKNAALSDIFNTAKLTGGITSTSSLRQKGKSIRSDIGWYINEVPTKKGVAVEEKTNLPIELQKRFEFTLGINEKNENVYTGTADKNDPDIINTYLKSHAAGLLLKTWKYSDRSGKEFGKASGLKEMIDEKFKDKEKTWDKTYAQAYANNIISKNLLAIIGPVNIALQTSSGLVWMDQFLSETAFYMTISLLGSQKEYWSKGRQEKNEIFPKTKNSRVLLRKTPKGLHAVSSVRRTKKNPESLTLYMKRKTVK